MAASCSVGMHFQMYGVSVKAVLKSQAVEMHEALRSKGLLVEVVDGMVVVFISHTWLGFRHPDPNMEHLHALQRILGRLSAGEQDIQCAWVDRLAFGDRRLTAEDCKDHFQNAFLWMDYWCIPQAVLEAGVVDAQRKAISSIPAYVARADHFLVLAPPCMHVDEGEIWGHQEWLARAWCRLEMMSRVFSKAVGHILVAETGYKVTLANSIEWLNSIPGEGQLTCCRLGHKVDKQGIEDRIPCDKEAISYVMQQLYKDKLNLHRASGEWQSFRFFLSLKRRLFSGLPGCPIPPATANLEDFLGAYGFKTAFDEEGRAGSGWSPLRFAAYEENTAAAKLLLAARANVECPTKARWRDAFHTENYSILMGVCLVNGNLNIVRLLLDHRANLHTLSAPEKFAPGEGCFGYPQALRLLIDRGHDVNSTQNVFGLSVIHWACLRTPHTVGLLLQEGVRPRNTAFGGSHIHLAVKGGSDVALRELLKNPAELEHAKQTAKPYGRARLILAAAAAATRVTDDPFWAFVAEWNGGSPLHDAASVGKVSAAKLLLAHGFELDARNRRGRTPVHLACLFGHRLVLEVFAKQHRFEEVAKIRCSHAGKTAAELAHRAGFPELLELLPEEDVAMGCCGRRRPAHLPAQVPARRDNILYPEDNAELDSAEEGEADKWLTEVVHTYI